MKPSLAVPIAVLLSAFVLASCANTIRGVGKDIKSSAQAVKETVQ